jgi:ComF family protein
VIYNPEPALAFRAHVYDYTGRPAQAVRRLKYSRATSLAEFMSHEILEAALRLGVEQHVAVPVPIHWRRRGSRGFNQSELLAERLLPRPALLRRSRPTAPQAGLKLKDRIANLEGAFEASAEVRGLPILLIDDVITTGHTARECAKALLAAGAAEVGILAFCGEN